MNIFEFALALGLALWALAGLVKYPTGRIAVTVLAIVCFVIATLAGAGVLH